MADGDLASKTNNFSSMITDFSSLLTLFKDKTTTQNSNNNTSEIVSPEKATALLEQMLGSVAGLAQVSSGQKAAGMYDSTASQFLTNDLISSIAGEVAARSSIKISSTEAESIAEAQGNLGKTAGVLGALQAGSSLYNTLGTTTAGKSLMSALGLGSSTAAAGGTAATTSGTVAAGTTASAAGAGTAAGSTGAAAGASSAGGIGATAGLAAVVANDFINLNDTIKNGSSAEKWGTVLLGPQGGPLVKALQSGDPFDALGPTGKYSKKVVKKLTPGWIICTELHAQGRMPYKFYRHGAKKFMTYSAQGKQGYYIWAIPSVLHLRKHPDSLYSKLLEVIFNARAEYIAAQAGCYGARKTVFGAVITHGVYAFCWILSKTIATKAYTNKQIQGVK